MKKPFRIASGPKWKASNPSRNSIPQAGSVEMIYK